ncbi:cytochrome c biogenesis protein ResB [Verticiella sediminum]|uniref:Cytochrome c biogenesis protein ResB n=2 Tax=Verticiella sediminum TaxID=1247510 RepID=A0A556AMX1_9BURK|nr:cytochrome c biogenesis protein ResB [Verticiella sediminum]
MRFAISLLTLISIASVAGTVLPQNQPLNNYVDQFGPFWARLFDLLQLYNVYNAGWFLLIMTFLVLSTSVCLWRNAPTLLRDAMSFREHARETSWRSFPHRAEAHADAAPAQAAERAERWLTRRGFRVRARAQGEGMVVAAKAGAGNRLGYICAHLAIVVICVGGLFDSELPIRLQVWLGGKQPVYENMRLADVPGSGRLSVDNPGYRATALIPEGVQTANSVVMLGDGALVQPLPFQIRLDKFTVDYYATGMPSDFRSDVTVTDPQTGESFPYTIRVNEPLTYKGVTVYQSSFDDGGSSVTLTGYALDGLGGEPFRVQGVIGDTVELADAAAPGPAGALRFTALRPINVENVEQAGAAQPMALGEHVAAVTGSAVRDLGRRFQNVGPSIEYQLVDAAGQVSEFHNYMLPVTLDDQRVFLLGTRRNAQESFRYVRIPAGEDGTLTEFLQLRATLADGEARAEAARRFARRNTEGGQGAAAAQEMARAVEDSANRALDVFADGGLQALTAFLEANVPADELPRAAEVVVRLLGGAMADLRAVSREAHGLPPVDAASLALAQQQDAWLRQSLAALSDLSLYPAPVAFVLSDFKHVQASVFQLNRSPGKLAVYTGCLLLVMGVFAMFYVRERRLWVWLRPEGGGSRALMAMTSQRRTLDFNQEFKRLEAEFARLYGKRGDK